MPTDVEVLMEMGFPKNRAERALAKSGYKGPHVAMDWLFAHEDDPDIDDPFEAPKGHTLGATAGGDQSAGGTEAPADGQGQETTPSNPDEGGQQNETAKSLKCDDCGKLLKTSTDVEMHAARTGHANFSESTEEIKPLTEDEKRQKMADVQERIKQKRLEKEAQEKRDQIEREKQRRMHGKEIISARAKIEEEEMKKIVEQRRREKEEEKRARQKVKEDIERDKRERAAKLAKKTEPQVAPGAAAAAPTSPPAQTASKKDYDQCRLQIRLTNGQAITQSFGSKEPLAAVRLYIQMKRTDGQGPFVLMTTFPRKVFSEEDMEKPLFDLGLVPSAVLVVTKPQ